MQDNMVEFSELVTITAQFSEVMSNSPSPTLLLLPSTPTGAFIQAVPGSQRVNQYLDFSMDSK